MRRHYNYNSPVYRKLCSVIVEKAAEHYGQRPCIVGWQIDNEINCEVDVFYSESDTAAFREFLKGKYGTLDALNEAWGTVFWNQTYTEWEEIYVPDPLCTIPQIPIRFWITPDLYQPALCGSAKCRVISSENTKNLRILSQQTVCLEIWTTMR